ncbi:hypothetical protein [Thermofilum sp.]
MNKDIQMIWEEIDDIRTMLDELFDEIEELKNELAKIMVVDEEE